MNQTKMPAEKARPTRKILRGDSPACLMKPKIFSAITGSTHGIRFKINPPAKPKRTNFERLACCSFETVFAPGEVSAGNSHPCRVEPSALSAANTPRNRKAPDGFGER